MTKRTLQRLGYSIKHTAAVGWWVDGAFGYLVAGYWPSEAEAVTHAAVAITTARQAGAQPAWFIN
ncbi:MAG: hypothetical protein O9327_03280 [Polaromonas sp.]|nr:hypothetical protein [Polaromonas sp.]